MSAETTEERIARLEEACNAIEAQMAELKRLAERKRTAQS